MGLATPMGPFPRVITTATELRSPRGCALGPFAAPAPPHATPTEVEVFDADAAAAACKVCRSKDGRGDRNGVVLVPTVEWDSPSINNRYRKPIAGIERNAGERASGKGAEGDSQS